MSTLGIPIVLVLICYVMKQVYSVYDTTAPTFHYFHEKVTFEESKERCSSRGLTLATPTTVGQQDAMLGRTSYFPVTMVTDVWLGLQRDDVTGNFTWIDQALPVWTNWAGGEPKDHSDCVALKRHTGREYNAPYQWYVSPCLNEKGYICQGECLHGNGVKYRGRMNVTISGTPCLRWSDGIINEEVLPNAGLGSHNFCRNPGSTSLPWCFVGNSKGWEICDIPKCCPRKDVDEGCAKVINGNSSKCTEGETEMMCCEICGRLKDVDYPGCPYGDIRSDCLSKVEENGPLLFSKNDDVDVDGCCRTAASLIDPDTSRHTFTTCPYKDVPMFRIRGVKNSCQGHIVNLTAAFVCSEFYFWCCQSCFAVLNNAEADCPWGDSLACQDIISSHGLVACTWAGIEDVCCQTCSGLRNSSYSSCPSADAPRWIFDDVTNTCQGHIANLTLSGVCGNMYLSKYCCSTCLSFEAPTQVECSVGIGVTYSGMLNITIDDESCIPWEQTVVNEYTHPGKGLSSNNYCRNPDNDAEGLWCFTESGRGYCYVPPCDDVDCYVGSGSNYRGTTNVTIDGDSCLPWGYMSLPLYPPPEKPNPVNHNFCRILFEDPKYAYGNTKLTKLSCLFDEVTENTMPPLNLKNCPLLPCSSFINCPYGDVSRLYINDHLLTCQNLVQDIGLYDVCTDAIMAPRCCGTCQALMDSTDPACPYGDRDTKWCIENILREGSSFCLSNELVCCKVCDQYKDHSNPGCAFGDNLAFVDCENEIADKGFESTCLNYKEQCCKTCQFKLNNTQPCPDSGTPTLTINGETDTCSGHIEYFSAKRVCTHSTLSTFCCQRCAEIKASNPHDCPWGDDGPFRNQESFIYDSAKGIHIEQKPVIRCKETIARYGLIACTWDIEELCCKTCSSLRPSDHTPCPAPDIPMWTFDGVRNSCQGHIQNLTAFGVCGNSILSPYCCVTCNKLKENGGIADIDCFNGNGIAYRGNVNVSADGKECISWEKAAPRYREAKMSYNHCRHPGNVWESGIPLVPYCMTEGGSEDDGYGYVESACDVPRCDDHLGCPFGDAKMVNMKGTFRTCKGHVEYFGAFSVCNDERVVKYCCKTCGDLRNNDNPSCPYGDDRVVRVTLSDATIVEGSCQRLFDEYSEWKVCGSAEYSFHCCESCARLEADGSSCPYRDSKRHFKMTEYPYSYISCEEYFHIGGPNELCSNSEKSTTSWSKHYCCETCSKLYAPGKPSCSYGDAKKFFTENSTNRHGTTTCEEHILEIGVETLCDNTTLSSGRHTASLCCATCARLQASGDTESCGGDEFRCRYTGACISGGWRCDGSEDCTDGTDEEDCSSCEKYLFTCNTGGQCVKCSAQCDGTRDCRDGSDEEGCDGAEISCLDPSGSSKEDIVYVMELLFKQGRYDKRVRPVKKAEDTLNVTMEVQLKSMFDVSENDQTMTTMCLVTMQWTDDFLKWSDGNMMKNVQNIQVKQDNVWVPDITVGNIVSENWHMGDKHVTLRIDRDGLVTWSVNAFIVSECEIVVEYYPFDTQICSLDFTTEQSPQKEIRLINFNEVHQHSALHIYGEDGTWRMLGYRIKNMISQDGRQRQITRFSFYLTRRHSFYLVSFIAPVILLSNTACLVFVIPADAGEKMGTSMTVLLAFAVYLTIVTEYLPDTSLQVSYLALYLTVLLGLCTLSVILTTFILHIYHFPEDHPVGPKVTRLVKVMQKITCFSNKAESQQQHARDLQEIRHMSTNGLVQGTTAATSENDPCNEEWQQQGRASGAKYRVITNDEEPLTWKIVSKTFDWFFYLSFTLVVVLVTVGYLGVSLYEGIVMADRHNNTGTLLPTFGRKNIGVGLGGQVEEVS